MALPHAYLVVGTTASGSFERFRTAAISSTSWNVARRSGVSSGGLAISSYTARDPFSESGGVRLVLMFPCVRVRSRRPTYPILLPATADVNGFGVVENRINSLNSGHLRPPCGR